MRDIRFRGFHPNENGKEKAFVNGEWVNGYWVYGFYVHYDDILDNHRDDCDYIIERHNGKSFIFKKVIPETVGQYVGLKDKNSKEIYDGDIVKYGDTVHKVVFESRNGTAYFGLVYSGIETLPFGHYQDFEQIEVIGNIFENPELASGV